VPAITGRIVATLHPLAFVGEANRNRRNDVIAFFDPATPAQFRQEVLGRYCVSFLLLPPAGPSVASGLEELGTVRHVDGPFTLVALPDPPANCREGRKRMTS